MMVVFWLGADDLVLQVRRISERRINRYFMGIRLEVRGKRFHSSGIRFEQLKGSFYLRLLQSLGGRFFVNRISWY